MLHRHEHQDVFDQAFNLFWRDPTAAEQAVAIVPYGNKGWGKRAVLDVELIRAATSALPRIQRIVVVHWRLPATVGGAAGMVALVPDPPDNGLIGAILRQISTIIE